MSLFDPCSSDIGRWHLGDGHGVCPDCAGLVAAGAIAAHVDWHTGLRQQFFGGESPADPVVERFDDASGELSRIAHEFQVARLWHSGQLG